MARYLSVGLALVFLAAPCQAQTAKGCRQINGLLEHSWHSAAGGA